MAKLKNLVFLPSIHTQNHLTWLLALGTPTSGTCNSLPTISFRVTREEKFDFEICCCNFWAIKDFIYYYKNSELPRIQGLSIYTLRLFTLFLLIIRRFLIFAEISVQGMQNVFKNIDEEEFLFLQLQCYASISMGVYILIPLSVKSNYCLIYLQYSAIK